MTDYIHVHLESAAVRPESVHLFSLRGTEAIERFFEFELEITSTTEDDINQDALLAGSAALVFTRGGTTERRIFGAIHSIRDGLVTETDRPSYTLTFAPRAWPMMHHKRSEVFVSLSVPDIIKKKLERAALDLSSDVDFRLRATYLPREFVMQYEETDLEFCSRLCEHLGISFFFEHASGKDVLVFVDDNSGFSPIEGGGHATFYRRGEETGVFALASTTRTVPAKYVLKDYNYRTPTVALTAETTVDPAGKGDVLEYGAHFTTPDEGNRIATIRAQELMATKRIFVGDSDVPRLACGARFTLDGHPRIEGELLVTSVTHRATQPGAGAATGEERTYTNEFAGILADVTYRPPRRTPKPRVHGAISAVVESDSGPQYAELDDQGRYHVRFMLDQGDAPKGGASSLLRMAQPHAGPGYGFHFPLRDGVEVVVTCIEGDPDRPMITAAVPNPTTPSTVGSGNAARNVIRTGGGTEINLDDTEGATRLKISVPHGNTTFQLGAPNSPTSGAFIGTDNDAKVVAKGTITLSADTKIHAESPLIELKGGASVHSQAPAISMVGDANISGSAPVIAFTGSGQFQVNTGDISLEGNASIKEMSPTIKLDATAVLNMSAGAVVLLTSGGSVTISAPVIILKSTSLLVDSPAITVNGSTINVAGSTVNVKGGTINLNS